eukprot:CAMPEP_0202338720 /NCGR_PEP_ID=MMETSP1126-20121109/881_1 /ASSEMBLY_ACC=CAM_ASM_000457 /TAXON_ID=3047 /ORGANISM="Dunaliella tertiolecta, Strain CCMP1320" /LENGTH=118 /DNA_ID=CAMNT_0048929151 /DNA_START=249 /DNA_END=603 /DNA_ORIENTATION=-
MKGSSVSGSAKERGIVGGSIMGQEFAEDIKQAMVWELRASHAAAGNALSGPALNPLLAQANRFCEPKYINNSRHRLAVVEEGPPPEILDNEELGEQRGGGAGAYSLRARMTKVGEVRK